VIGQNFLNIAHRGAASRQSAEPTVAWHRYRDQSYCIVGRRARASITLIGGSYRAQPGSDIGTSTKSLGLVDGEIQETAQPLASGLFQTSSGH
jgi:hypothetical protein